MSDSLQLLYESRPYPAMSHPLTDPAVTAVAAMLGGLDVPVPSRARILEIGCSSGHNLIPLALRWPEARFCGVDFSAPAIRMARELAEIAGAPNVDFHCADVRNFQLEEGAFDFIIAHGVFSWVPDDVKSALLKFCGRHLSRSGIATISFNLECGWQDRLPVIRKARAILAAGAADEMSALAILRTATARDSPEYAVIEDMLAKGPGILPFDDFAPINDPWPLRSFVELATAAGLHWLGESDPAKNLPRSLDDETLDSLLREAPDAISYQEAIDREIGRTFRSGILCRSDAPLGGGCSLARVFDLAGRAGRAPAASPVSLEMRIFRQLSAWAPLCLPLAEVRRLLPEVEARQVAMGLHDGIQRGWILPRIESVWFDPDPPQRPALSPFRLECARRQLPLVDAWHRPCLFPDRHFEILAAMDGSRDQALLAILAGDLAPDLAFRAWLRHLAERGMFA
jgi:SAM-dependent methyltransferase